MILTLDDAVKVAKRYCDEPAAVLRNEFEQKCWVETVNDEPRKHLIGLIMLINPAEIAKEIKKDRLREWCESMQVSMLMELDEQLPKSYREDEE